MCLSQEEKSIKDLPQKSLIYITRFSLIIYIYMKHESLTILDSTSSKYTSFAKLNARER